MAPRLAPIRTLADLRQRANADAVYAQLAMTSARNLGGINITDVDSAMRCLQTNAMETTEDGVVDEVNFCRDLVRKKNMMHGRRK